MSFKNGVSTNFWFSVIALFTIVLNQLGVNIDESQLTGVVEAIATKQITVIVLAVVGAAMMLYNVFKNQGITGKFIDVFKTRNFWTGLITTIAALFSWQMWGDFPVDQAENLTNAVYGGNISLIIGAAWTFAQSLWFIWKDNKPGEISTEKS